MRLENEPPSQSQQTSGVRLSASEMDAVLNRAIARESSGQRLEPREATLEDAVEIARELGISEAQVRASFEEVRAEQLKVARREEKREALRRRRRAQMRFGFGAAALAAVVAGLIGIMDGLHVQVLALPALLILASIGIGLRAFFARITDQDADQVELLPVAGTCRVCGKTAYTPQSTFCEEHRYRGPRP